MSVPTCKRCGTKFPGKEICKICGGDPNTEPTLEEKIAEAKAEREAALRGVTASLKQTRMQFETAKKLSAKRVAKLFSVPTTMIASPETLVRERRVSRARLRSLEATRTSGRANKHGRKGVR